MAILETINSPADLRRLDQSQLAKLAEEVRAFLVEQTSRTGGHLSPNLGVVELTFALHRVFDSPKDAIVWDTGHQAYVHKLVTGRAAAFPQLRQAGGMAGYPSRNESEHDLVENSHASTSLSYALGIAEARLRTRIGGFDVAVIGDGAVPGGGGVPALHKDDTPPPPAPKDEADRLHGASAFDPLTGRPRSTEMTYTDIFGEALMTSAARRPEVCAITAAMASSTGLLNFAKEFPDRFFDVGICEQHAVTFAAGLGIAGLHPPGWIFLTFLARALGQKIIDDAPHQPPLGFLIDRPGVAGPGGGSHH